MLPIEIDISPILQTYSELTNRGSELSAYILDSIIDSYMFQWENNVNSGLHQTRQEYKNSMFVERVDDYNAIIGLTPSESSLAMMIEDGASPFDIKSGMEKSSKKHIKSDGGWYMTVPFRFASSEALGESMIFSNKLPKQVQEAVLRQPINIITQTTSPLKNEDLPSKYQQILKNKTTGYKHKSSIYEGVRRQEISSTKNEKRGGYFSFRRISDKSDEDAWIHPGFKPHKFMEKTMSDIQIDSIVSKAIDDFMEGI